MSNEVFLSFARKRWLIADSEAERCLRHCQQTGKPAWEAAQELGLLDASVAQLVLQVATECSTEQPPADATSPHETLAAMPKPSLHIGRYEPRQVIGRGGMGVVYEAWDPAMSRTVALKVLTPSGSDTATDLARFAREARAVAGMGRHPNVIDVYDAGESDGIHYYTMEMVPGKSMALWLKCDNRSLEEIVEVARDVAAGLGFAHDHGIVHRDLKPENVMLTPEGRSLVMDFGLAREIKSQSKLTASGVVVGTAAYMSPEQAKGKQDLGPASDIFSLGVMLYEAFAGHHPFEQEDLISTLIATATLDPGPLRDHNPDVSEELDAIVMRCMEKQPERRYADGTALCEALDGWLQKRSPLPATPATKAPPATPATKAPQATPATKAPQATPATEAPQATPATEAPQATSGPAPMKQARAPQRALAGALVTLVAVAGLAAWALGSSPHSDRSEPATTPSAAARPSIQVTLTSPPDGLVTSDNQVLVEGDLSTKAPTTIWIAQRAVTVEGGHFLEIVDLPVGTSLLGIQVDPDEAALVSVTVHVDTTPPLVVVDSPLPGQLTSGTLMQLRGSVQDEHLSEVTMSDGEPLPMDAAGVFHTQIPLPGTDGRVVKEILARDQAGNQTRRPLSIVVDRSAPRIIELSPATDTTTQDRTLLLKGRVEDAHPGRLLADGALVVLSADGRFEVPVALDAEATRVVVLEARDQLGHVAKPQRWRITHDGTAPVISLEAPAEGLVTRRDSVEVRGRVTDAHPPKSLRIGDHEVGLGADGFFQGRVPIDEGETRLVLEVTDRAGNGSSVTRTISCDATPPTITLDVGVDSPRWGQNRTLVVSGQVSEDRCRIRINGETVEVRDRLFETPLRLRKGDNPVEIAAVDPAGNQQRLRIVVPYQAKRTLVPKGAWWKPTRSQLAYARETEQPVWFENAVGMRFVLIPPGEFVMGSPPGEKHRAGEDQETQHLVILTRGFYLSATEVTNAQYSRFRVHDSAHHNGLPLNGEGQPAVNVVWKDARDFCEWLNRQHGGQDRYRLPHEAEWEYACRSGTKTAYFWGDDPALAHQFANTNDPLTKKLLGHDFNVFPLDDGYRASAPVTSYKPNAWGLFDMLGNASEWCGDWFAMHKPDAQTNPTGPGDGTKRILRGGSWGDGPYSSRSASRGQMIPEWHGNTWGFRVLVEGARVRTR